MIKDIIISIVIILSWLLSTTFVSHIAFSWILTVCTVGWHLFNHWIWKWFRSTITKQYDISGTWTGELHYNYEGKAVIKNVTATITQIFTESTILIKTDEMLGKSIVSKWQFSEDKLFYIYRTDPKSEFKDKNQIQYGGAQIKIDPKDLKKIRIEYWTDRGTKGHMELRKDV